MRSDPEVFKKPAWLSVRLIKTVGRGSYAHDTPLANESVLLGFVTIRRSDAMTKKKLIGEIGIGVDEKLNDVFGSFTSLGVHISLRFPGDVNEFEREVDKFTKRSDAKVKQIMNSIAAQSGVKSPWGREKKS